MATLETDYHPGTGWRNKEFSPSEAMEETSVSTDYTKDWPQLYQIWVWGVYVPILVLATLLFGTLAIVLSLFDERLGQPMGLMWGRVLCWGTFVRVRVHNRERIEPNKSYVLMMNHRSLFDIPAVYGYLGRQFRWVMKKELRRIPFFGFAVGQMGHVYVDRSNREKAIASLQAAAPKIKNGVSILFFPEGTRSRTEEMLPFKKGGFMTALTLGLPIVPITIKGTRPIMPRGKAGTRPGTVDIFIHEPIDSNAYGEKRRDEFMGVVRQRIESV